MEYEAEGSRLRGRTKWTLREVVQKDCQACKLSREDAVDPVTSTGHTSVIIGARASMKFCYYGTWDSGTYCIPACSNTLEKNVG